MDKKSQNETSPVTGSLLETTLNTRDLGGYRIEGTDLFTRSLQVFRSDAAIYPSEKDIAFLQGNGITTIIDTRTAGEVERKPHGFCNLEGFDYFNFPIVEGSGIPESVEAVPDSYFAIAHDPSITRIFQKIADAESGVIINCSAGKDRTGVNSALLLWLCGVSKEDIVSDYMITKENNAERFKLIHRNFPDIDMNIVIPRENFMRDFLIKMEKAHGSVREYFISMGITEDFQEKIRRKMLGESK